MVVVGVSLIPTKQNGGLPLFILKRKRPNMRTDKWSIFALVLSILAFGVSMLALGLCL
jgi:hypothetical protein